MDLSNITTFAMIGVPAGSELILIFFVVLLLFGAKKLPELARGMGKAINEFKRASSDIESEFKQSLEDKPEPKKAEKTKEPEFTQAKSANNDSN